MGVQKSQTYTVDTSFETWSYTQVGNNPLPPRSKTIRHQDCFKNMQHDGNVPNFRYLIKHGLLATSGFSGQVQQFKFESGQIIYHYTYTDIYGGPVQNTHDERTGNLVGEPTATYPGSVSTTEAQNQAKMRFLQKCLDTQTSLQTGVVLGELGETLHMIRHPAQTLFEGIFDYAATAKKRRNRAKPHNRKRVVADTWLEYSYGWAPLISDIDSGMKALARMAETPPEYKFISAEYHVDSGPAPYPFQTGSGLFDKYEATFNKSTARCVYRGMVNTNPPTASRNLNLFGVSWSQIIPTVWELIPYSFLVDYFTNIGAVLNANAFNQAQLRWYQMTVLRQNEVSNVLTACIPTLVDDPKIGHYTQQLHGSGSATATIKLVDRSPGTTAIVPSFAFKLPFCDTQWLNIAALARARQ
jgi:hypothetical protein